MSEGYVQNGPSGRELRCEFERTLKGEYCGERSEVRLEGLLLCEHHAEQLRLEELVAYWRAIMAHIQLWSGEARSRGRGDMTRLLEIERLRASMDLERASTALQRIQDVRSRDGQDGSGDGRALRPLPPLLLLSTAVTG